MRAGIICFTEQGAETAGKIKGILEETGMEALAWCKKKGFQGGNEIESLEGTLREWTEKEFSLCGVLVFVGATGIAVRSIAPFLKSKVSDPAVIAVDEQGKFVISLVSGHIGGANELCERLADRLGAIPVITTATDLNQKFAVDVFAGKNNLRISDMKMAKWISAALLDGETVGFHSDFPVEGRIPSELQEDTWTESGMGVDPARTGEDIRVMNGVQAGEAIQVTNGVQEGETMQVTDAVREKGIVYGIDISVHHSRKPYPETLLLVPKVIVLGIGCRKGKGGEELEAFIMEILQRENISLHALEKVCSINVKAREEGILRFCEKYHLPFETYTAEQLRSIKGDFETSAFVSQQVGVDNVCERSAVLGSGGGRLLVRKTAREGMTVSMAMKDWRVRFE